MVKFEYLVVSSTELNDIDDENLLNEYGKKGWELAGIFILPTKYHTFYFKKKVVSSEGSPYV